MIKIEIVRERYHYGTKDARLYRDIAIETKPTWRVERLLDVLLFCVFFSTHGTYKIRLEGTRPKGHVYLPDFRELMRSLLVEWSDSNLLATVFVSYVLLFWHKEPDDDFIFHQCQRRLPSLTCTS
jgi:hypothetical protein